MRMMRRIPSVPLLVLLIAGCDNTDPEGGVIVARDSAGVRIVHNAASAAPATWRIDDAPLFTAEQAGANAVGAFLHRGQLIVVDGGSTGSQRLLVHDGAGRLVAELGAGSAGDCAFRRLRWSQPFRRDSVVAYDEQSHAVSVFDPDGRCTRRMRLPNWRPTGSTDLFAPGAYGAFADGSLLVHPYGVVQPAAENGAPEWYVHTLLHVQAHGAAWDTLGMFPLLPRRRVNDRIDWIPFGPIANVAVGRTSFWFGTGESFEIRKYSPDGGLQTIARYEGEHAAVAATDREQLTAFHVERARTARGDSAAARTAAEMAARTFPARKPAYSRLLVDADENVWVEVYRWPDPRSIPAQPANVHWLVFSPAGELIARVTLPGTTLLQWVGRNEVVVFHFDAAGGIAVAAHSLTRT